MREITRERENDLLRNKKKKKLAIQKKGKGEKLFFVFRNLNLLSLLHEVSFVRSDALCRRRRGAKSEKEKNVLQQPSLSSFIESQRGARHRGLPPRHCRLLQQRHCFRCCDRRRLSLPSSLSSLALVPSLLRR